MNLTLSKLKYRFRATGARSFVVVFTLVEREGLTEYAVYCYEHGVKGLLMDTVFEPTESVARRVVSDYIVSAEKLNLPKVR